jgi:hypothetical protein
LLAVDPEFAKRVRGKERTKLLSDPIATPKIEQRITAELRDAIARIAKQPMRPPADTDDRAFFLFGMRLLMADIVARGLASLQNRQVLIEATLFLREAWDDCEVGSPKNMGREPAKRHDQRPGGPRSRTVGASKRAGVESAQSR